MTEKYWSAIKCDADVFIYIDHVLHLQWRHNESDGVSNHQPHNCSLNLSFWRNSKKTSKLRVTGLCEGNSPVAGEIPAQRNSNAKNVSIWWRHHGYHNLVQFRQAREYFIYASFNNDYFQNELHIDAELDQSF